MPRKNLRELCGKPLIWWTIDAAQKSGIDFVVSTDDDEIAGVAKSYGAKVLQCAPGGRLHSDECTSGEVLIDAMERMPEYDAVVCLHPTSPIRDPAHIKQAIDLLRLGLPVASVKEIRRKSHPPVYEHNWAGGYMESLYGRHFVLNASIYAMKRDQLLKTRSHTHDICMPLIMDGAHSVDIDTEEDFALAEFYLRQRMAIS